MVNVKRYTTPSFTVRTKAQGKRARTRKIRSILRSQVVTKIRVVATVASNAGGVISFSYSDNPNGFRDWTSFTNLYDDYKVKAIKFQYYPYLPNDTSTVTGFLPLYSIFDDNTTATPVTSVNDCIEYNNCKQYNMYRPWKRYVRWKTTTANAATVTRSGWVPTASPTASQCVAFYGDGYDISTSYGSVVVTMYVKFRNRK